MRKVWMLIAAALSVVGISGSVVPKEASALSSCVSFIDQGNNRLGIARCASPTGSAIGVYVRVFCVANNGSVSTYRDGPIRYQALGLNVSSTAACAVNYHAYATQYLLVY